MVKMRPTERLVGRRTKVVVVMASGTKPVTVRWSEGAHAVVVHEAEIEGIPLARYMREAALARAFYAIGRRSSGDQGFAERLCHMTQELDELGVDGMAVLERILEHLSFDHAGERRGEADVR
jgi:hypothetical protein